MSQIAEKKLAPSSIVEDASTGVLIVIKAIRKNWPLVVACAIFALGTSFFYSKSIAKVYDAQALIELNPNVVRPLGEKSDSFMPMGAGMFWDNQEYYETQYKIITSQSVLSAVSRDLNLPQDYSFFGLQKAPPTTPTADDTATVLRARVKVEPIKNSRLLWLHVEDTDPKRARRICESIANTYIDQNLEMAVNATSDAVVWLNGQLDHVRQELETSEEKLHVYKKDKQIPSTSINEASNMVRLEMQEFDTSLSRTRSRKQELLARHAELAKVSDESPDDLPASEFLSNQFLKELRGQYQAAQKERKELLASGKGENHPQVKSVDEKIAESKTSLLSEVKNIKGAVAKDLAIIQRQEAGESGLFESARQRAIDLNLTEIEYHRLDRSRDQNEKLYSLLNERQKEAEVARRMRVNNIRLVDKPLEPGDPVRPKIGRNLTIGFVIGILLGVLLAWLREQLDSSVKTPDDVEHKLGLTFLGLLPEIEGNIETGRSRRRRAVIAGHQELVVAERPMSGIAEAARGIRTNLMFMSPDRPYRTLLVTSAAPAEGKTTVACSIAIALAQGGQRVCVVDCDLRRPRLHRIFNRIGDAGVTNVLVGDATIEEVAKATGIDNLWCIPSGPIPPNPADVLHSTRFKTLQELGERFDRVIIDSPPLVAVTDSAIVSTLVDGTVFVIRAFKTTRALGRQGLRSMADVDSPVVGAVLNAVNFDKHEYNYYHYYYYKREGYGSIPQGGPKDRESQTGASSASPPN